MGKWDQWLNAARRKPLKQGSSSENGPPEVRTELERDYDRILFSTPVRRLADKTQVFPLERNDSVRTRLTHSYEVSNLAKSIGTSLVFEHDLAKEVGGATRSLPALLAATGLAHDLGNPPFGHQGENAISSWYADKANDARENIFDGLENGQELDFLRFEGNAQTLRLVTRLQLVDQEYGLNLTYATLAALMKYPCTSNAISDDNASTKKFGVFQSEANIAKDIWNNTALEFGIRHPLAYIMEACDDIAYSVLDVEDAVKKQLVSFYDIVEFLQHNGESDRTIKFVVSSARSKHREYRKSGMSPAELNDVSTQRFRVYAIGIMIDNVRTAFLDNLGKIEKGDFELSLIEVSESATLCETLKEFAKKNAYMNRTVRELELQGYSTIRGIMDYLWQAISKWDPVKKKIDSAPFEKYVYSRISENYRRVFENEDDSLPIRYKQLQLISDMISGMTDSFAIDLFTQLKMHDGP